ncbi:MAG: DegV family protein [Pygmaiobacter sp.]
MIRIITDSTADFSPAQQAEFNVQVVPLNVNFGTEEVYRDGIDLDSEEFYARLVTCDKLPTTSQPSPDLFLREFEAARESGDDIVTILLSSKISGTVQSAELARGLCEGWGEHIFIVDSLNATLGLQLLCRKALELRCEGCTAETMVQVLLEERKKLRVYAVVDTLKYFQKGGRLPKATAVAGTLLGIKPVVAIQGGKLAVVGKARGLAGAYVTIFKLIAEEVGGMDTARPYMVGYTGHANTIKPFHRYICDTLHLPDPLISPIGAVIGTHAGPGACGIAYFAATNSAL